MNSSLTFYTISENNAPKHLSKEIKNESIFKKITTWKQMIDAEVEENAIKYLNSKNPKIDEETKKELKSRHAYGTLALYPVNMLAFGFNEEEIKQVIEWACKNYNLSDDNKEMMEESIKLAIISYKKNK